MAAKGQYLMFFNGADFLLNKEVLSFSMKIINLKRLDIYYGDVKKLNTQGKIYIEKHASEMNLNFLEKRTINHQASFIKSSLFLELGVYDTRYPLAADYAFYLKSFTAGKTFSYLDSTLVNYDTEGLSSTNMDKYILQMNEIWLNKVPPYANKLFNENKEYRYLMHFSIMIIAKKLNINYQALRNWLR